MTILPRTKYLTARLTVDGQQPLPFGRELIDNLPEDIRTLTGCIRSIRFPQQGFYLVIVIEAEHGSFILKVGCSEYRSQELLAEHTVMKALADSQVPVPKPLVFAQQEDLSFQLREFCAGEPVYSIQEYNPDCRPDAIRKMGKVLADIHRQLPASDWTWHNWINASLEEANRNLDAGILDTDEFTADAPPDKVLNWLYENVPQDGTICLLHGDYRPKNILWQNSEITGIIDWAFVDIGDPYYDLSIINWYFDIEDWNHFISAYGITDVDTERLQYYVELQKFLNV